MEIKRLTGTADIWNLNAELLFHDYIQMYGSRSVCEKTLTVNMNMEGEMVPTDTEGQFGMEGLFLGTGS